MAPPEPEPKSKDDYSPFSSRPQFELAEFLFTKDETSAAKVDELMKIWSAFNVELKTNAPFANHQDLHHHIDAVSIGHVPWESFTLSYQGEQPQDQTPPKWMTKSYEVFFRDPRSVVHNLLGNPDFKDGFDYTPFREFANGTERRWSDFMSGDWAWNQAVRI